jgi:gluconate 2-dehydrogenase gamma chain
MWTTPLAEAPAAAPRRLPWSFQPPTLTKEAMQMSDKPSERSDKPAENTLDRRNFFKIVGAAGAIPLAAAPAAAMSGNDMAGMKMAAANDSAAAPATAAAAEKPGYIFFNANEAAFIEAAVDVLIPHDDTGPGALELGVNTYIDRQMAGAYGKGYRLYLAGPYGEGTPEQGWQLAMTPSELIRGGIADADAYAQSSQKDFFSSLPREKQVAVMQEIEAGKASFATVPAKNFFGELLALVTEGYLGDPIYGGNEGKAAWTMLGFPGANAMYMDKIEPFRNKQYTFEPQGIQDLI